MDVVYKATDHRSRARADVMLKRDVGILEEHLDKLLLSIKGGAKPKTTDGKFQTWEAPLPSKLSSASLEVMRQTMLAGWFLQFHTREIDEIDHHFLHVTRHRP